MIHSSYFNIFIFLFPSQLTIKELLASSCNKEADLTSEVVVYDQGTADLTLLSADNFLGVLLCKLNETFKSVSLLAGKFKFIK